MALPAQGSRRMRISGFDLKQNIYRQQSYIEEERAAPKAGGTPPPHLLSIYFSWICA